VLGTIVNCSAIIAGSTIGFFLKKGIPGKYNDTIMQAIGLAVILVGMKSALGCDDLLIIIVSLGIGSVAGEFIGIENGLKKFGDYLESKFSNTQNDISKSFVTASLMYCVGSMAIVGSLESGLTGNHSTLFAKAAIDGIVAIILTSSIGVGVFLSSVPVFIYQGSITLAAVGLKPLLIPSVVSQMSGVGGLLIIALGINMLREEKIKVGNMLPSIFIPLIFFVIIKLF